MTSAGSVGTDDAIRLFLALRLPLAACDAIAAWADASVRGGKRVPCEQFHITLAFLGPRPRTDLSAVVDALRGAARLAREIVLEPHAWRETHRVGMLVFADHGGAGAELQVDLAMRLEALGVYRREHRPWLPHVTVVRHRAAPGLEIPLPAMRTLVPSDAAAYLSRPHSNGVEYEVLATARLGRRHEHGLRSGSRGIGRTRRNG